MDAVCTAHLQVSMFQSCFQFISSFESKASSVSAAVSLQRESNYPMLVKGEVEFSLLDATLFLAY